MGFWRLMQKSSLILFNNLIKKNILWRVWKKSATRRACAYSEEWYTTIHLFDIKRMLLVILVLNLIDGICTAWGLSNQWIEEANPLMSSFSPLTILGIKVCLSCVILSLWKSNFPTRLTNVWRVVLSFVMFLYSGIFILHITWMVLVLIWFVRNIATHYPINLWIKILHQIIYIWIQSRFWQTSPFWEVVLFWTYV